MIYITQDTNSKVCLTLSESATIGTPYYLFAISRNFDLDESPTYISYTDESGYPEVFNLFTFNLDIPSGEYTYRVYESATPNPTTPSGDIIEEGLMVVYSSSDVSTNIYL